MVTVTQGLSMQRVVCCLDSKTVEILENDKRSGMNEGYVEILMK